MKTEAKFVAGLPQLDIYTLSEDWALATSLENHWRLLGGSLGLPPSRWLDSRGDRMYGAVVALSTRFDLDDPMKEDDAFVAATVLASVRKPHALSTTQFMVGSSCKAEVTLLTSFIKRTQRGSNKKFSKVRDLWTADDKDGEIVEAWLDRHHALKDIAGNGEVAQRYEVNRIQDFNTADFLYFKNFVRIAKAAEWRENRGKPTLLNVERECFFYGNVEDGEVVETRVARTGSSFMTSHYAPDGRRIFISLGKTAPVSIPQR